MNDKFYTFNTIYLNLFIIYIFEKNKKWIVLNKNIEITDVGIEYYIFLYLNQSLNNNKIYKIIIK